MPRALLIDPVEESFKLFNFDEADNFEKKNELIGAETGTILMLKDDVVMWLDDEGRLKENARCFKMGEWLIVGKALVMGIDMNTEEQDHLDLELVDAFVLMEVCEFQPEGTDYTPSPPVIFDLDTGERIA